MFRVLIALVSSVAVPLAGQAQPFPDHTVTCNAHGAVVAVESGAFAGETFYLGKSCDAASASGGTGRWGWAASSLVVIIEGQGLRLGESVDCPNLPFCAPSQ